MVESTSDQGDSVNPPLKGKETSENTPMGIQDSVSTIAGTKIPTDIKITDQNPRVALEGLASKANTEKVAFDITVELQKLSQKLHIPVEELTHLKDKLTAIYDPNFSTLGHGTQLTLAPHILEEGLQLRSPDLGTTTVPIIEPAQPYKKQSPKLLETVLSWPHLNLKSVVVVMIPNVPDDQPVGGSMYFNSVIEELQEPEGEYGGYTMKYYVPREYVRGYIDAEKRDFIPNPHFAPKVPKIKLPPKGISMFHSAHKESDSDANIVVTPPAINDPDIW